MPDIMHFIRIRAPRERVYQAVTTADGIGSWWTRDAELDSTIAFDLRADGHHTRLLR